MLSVGVSLIQFLSQFNGLLYLSLRLLHYLEQEVRAVQLFKLWFFLKFVFLKPLSDTTIIRVAFMSCRVGPRFHGHRFSFSKVSSLSIML